MPKYSLDEILEILKNLTPEEKAQLQEQLPAVLDGAGAPASRFPRQTQQSPPTGSIGGAEVNARLLQAKIATHLDGTSPLPQSAEIQEALDLLRRIKKELAITNFSQKNHKKNLEYTLEVVLEELKKDRPDRDLIDLALASLEEGLRGVESSVRLTEKLAQIIRRALL